MVILLPSEIARLVLGYLEEQNCMTAHDDFLDCCSHLAECRGREFFTKIHGLTLNDMLVDYSGIYSYLDNIRCDDDFKKRIGKCQRLLDKVKLFVEDKYPTNSNHAKQLSRSSHNIYESQESHHRKVHRRNNSCDSVITTTDKSYGYHQRTISNDRNERCTDNSKFAHVDCDDECTAEATNLEDLPGYEDDGSYRNDNRSTVRRMHLSKKGTFPTSFTPNSKLTDGQVSVGLQSQSDNMNKSLDRTLTNNKSVPHPSNPESDLRSSLGLIKQSDSSQHNVSSKSPMKRKNIISRVSPLVRKAPHTSDPFPNESLNVTTFTNAMLDCPELHEIIADNINKIYNLSMTKPVESFVEMPKASETSQCEMSFPKPCEDSTQTNAVTNDDNMQEIENIIKSIVEKTEKEPLFNQLLVDLVASVESTSGTESDVFSRPGTSTPEKSAPSLKQCFRINETSPTSSYRSSITNTNKKFEIEEKSKRRKKRPKDLHFQDNRDELQNSTISPILPAGSESKNTQKNNDKSVKKYHPRYLRGGKKMDVLKENYKKIVGENQRLSVPTKASPSESDSRVIILSNERVQTNIVASEESIVLQKKGGKKDKKNIATEEIQPGNESVKTSAVHTEKIPDNVVDIITSNSHSSKSRNQNKKVKKTIDKNLHSQVVTGPDILLPQNCATYYTDYRPVTDLGQGNQNMSSCSSGYGEDSESWQKKHLGKYGRIVTGKPPELIITNGKVISGVGGHIVNMEPVYSESEIMKMSTIFVIQPSPIRTAASYIEVPMEQQCKPSDFDIPKTHAGKVVKEVTRKVAGNVQILPKITSLNDIVSALGIDSHSDEHQQFTLKVNSTMIMDKVPEPFVLPPMKNLSVIIEKDVEYSHKHNLNADISSVQSNDSSDGGRFVIDEDQKKNSADCPDSIAANKPSDTLGSVKDTSADFEFPKRKTPDVLITKRMSFSTPRRNFSHVRVLDFNTPSNTSNRSVSRKALTSPKISACHPLNKTLQTPSVSNKNTNFRSKMKNVKSCLFQHSEETGERVDKSIQDGAVTVDSSEPTVSQVWDQIQGVSQIIKPYLSNESKTIINESQSVQAEQCMNYINSAPTIVKCVKKPPRAKKPLRKPYAWDLNLRMMVGSMEEQMVPSKTELRQKMIRENKIRNRKLKSESLSNSLKKGAKLLEEALSKESFEAASAGPSKMVGTSQNKTNDDIIKDISPLVEKCKCVNVSIDSIAGDLELSTNTTTEEIANTVDSDIKIVASQDGCPDKVKPVSENSHPSNDSSNSRDHLINLKFKRDAYTKTNLLKKEVISAVEVSHPSKVNLISNQPMGAFKVKIPSKNHTNSVDELQDKKVEKPDTKRSESKTKSKSNKSNSKGKSKTKSKVAPDDLPPIVPSVEVEPPVPSVKITPDMSRGFNCNPLNAKCNLSSLLETPLKTIMMDLSMDTPRFLEQNFGEAESVFKILDIPTPNFVNTPSVDSWFAVKGHTPGSYSSRPTDYSGGSSYYKPDEVDDLKVTAITATKVDQLPVISEEVVGTVEDSNLSTRVLRPRPAISNKSVIKPQKPNSSNSIDKSSENVGDASISKNSVSSGCSCPISPGSSNGDWPLSSMKSFVKTGTPKKSFLSNKNHCTSTPISANVSSQQLKNEKQTNKCKDKENDSSHSQHDSLEEKLLRVKSKLAAETKKLVTPKLMSTKGPVVRLIKKKKSFSNSQSIKLPVKSSRNSGIRNRTKKNPGPVKRLSPLKKTPVKRCLPRKAKAKMTKKLQNSLLTTETAVKSQLSPEVKKIGSSLPDLDVISSVISKSRRKSSTPRKLEKLVFEPVSVELQKETHAKFLQLAEGSNNIPAGSVKKMHGEVENASLINVSDLERKSDALATGHTTSADDEEYPSLHLSSDEAETELTPPAALSPKSIDDSTENISQINEYITKSAVDKPKTVFQANLEKEGFDAESAKKIEEDLTDSLLQDDDSLLVPPVVTHRSMRSNTPVHTLTKDVDHPINENVTDGNSVKDSSNLVSKTVISLVPAPEEKSCEVPTLRPPIGSNGNTMNCNISIDAAGSYKNAQIVNEDLQKVISSSSSETVDPPGSKSAFIERVMTEKDQSSIVKSSSVADNNDENAVSPQADSEGPLIWDVNDCTSGVFHYIFMPSDKKSSIIDIDKQNIPRNNDLAEFTLNATLEDEEVQIITVSNYIDLFEIVPTESLTSKKLIQSERKRRSRELLVQCFNEVSISSNESCTPVKMPNDTSQIVHDRIDISVEQGELDVGKAVMAAKDITENISSKLTVVNKMSLKLNQSDETVDSDTVIDVEKESDGELSNSTVGESRENPSNTNNATNEKKTKKRKRTLHDSEESTSKKVKSITPHNLLKQIDIESVLSKLHGPQKNDEDPRPRRPMNEF